jgi:hypothetical protein
MRDLVKALVSMQSRPGALKEAHGADPKDRNGCWW